MKNKRQRFVQATLIAVLSACSTTYSSLVLTPANACSVMPAHDPPQKKDTEQEHQAILPDPVIQSAIRDLLLSVRSENEKEYKKLLRLLREESGESFERLIPQLIYYSIRSKGMREGMMVPVLIDQFEILDWQLVRALIPYLGTGDPKVEKEVRYWLAGTEDRSYPRGPDYCHYRALIAFKVQNGEEPPRNLIHYMYDSEPGTAVLTLMRAYRLAGRNEAKPIRWAEHLVADVLWKWRYGFLKRGVVEPEAVEALWDLSGHPRWWARLYVAEIMRQHPAFRTDELIAVLLTDPDESVRSVVTSFVTNNAQDD